jgi:predicted Mrr-cat superfamily restriction endonuclease
MADPKQAFVLRMSHDHDRVGEALERDEIIIGWAEAAGLLDIDEWGSFRKVVHNAYHSDDGDYRRSGGAAGHIWRFLKDMQEGDLVVVPHWGEFYVAKVAGPPTYDASKVDDDSAYRRRVTWLNGKRSIPRAVARAALQSRMKTQGTTADATDLVADILDALGTTAQKDKPTFGSDLRKRLVTAALSEIRSGRMDSYGFEKLVAAILERLGGRSVRIVPRSQDKGADITAIFRVAGAIQVTVAVQAKHYKAEPPVERHVLDDLVRGMAAELADFGIVATSGTFSSEAVTYAQELFDKTQRRVELLDGEQIASLVVEHGMIAELDGKADE